MTASEAASQNSAQASLFGLKEVLELSSVFSQVEPNLIASKILKELLRFSGSDGCALLRRDERDGLKILAAQGERDPDWIKRVSILAERCLLKRVSVSSEDDGLALQSPAVSSWIAIPLTTRLGVDGALIFENRSLSRAFQQTELKWFQLSGSHILTVLHNCEVRSSLESKMNSKTAKLEGILENIEQAILKVGMDLKIEAPCSAYAKVLLGEQELIGRDFLTVLFDAVQLDANAQDEVRTSLETSLGEEVTNYEFNSHLLPKEVLQKRPSRSNQTLTLEWNPILDGNRKVVSLLVSIHDESQKSELAQKTQAFQDELTILGDLVRVGPEMFLRFKGAAERVFSDFKARLQDPKQGLSGADVDVLFRDFHTLKGNARILKFSKCVESLHLAETALADCRKRGSDSAAAGGVIKAVGEANAQVEKYSAIFDSRFHLEKPVHQTSDLSKQLLSKCLLGIQVQTQAQKADQVRVLRSLLLQAQGFGTIEGALREVLPSMGDLAAELGKAPPQILFIDSSPNTTVLVEDAMQGALSDALIHILRNSIDHGIETGEERRRAGKSAAGVICFEWRLDPGATPALIISDDGRGLNLSALRKKLNPSPSKDPTDEEVAESIFAPGVSTAEKVTHTSGRGVGMDAVRAILAGVGATIQIEWGPKRVAEKLEAFRPFAFRVRFKAESLRILNCKSSLPAAPLS